MYKIDQCFLMFLQILYHLGWNRGLPSVESLLGVVINDLTGDDSETIEEDEDTKREEQCGSAAGIEDAYENEDVRINSLRKSKPVEILNDKGVVLQRFPSICKAGEVMQICRKRISECLIGPITSTGKFTWRLYKNPTESGGKSHKRSHRKSLLATTFYNYVLFTNFLLRLE
jgi:hypothetical protein